MRVYRIAPGMNTQVLVAHGSLGGKATVSAAAPLRQRITSVAPILYGREHKLMTIKDYRATMARSYVISFTLNRS